MRERMAEEQRDANGEVRPATSAILKTILEDAPHGDVTLSWLIDTLGPRSFGILMLLVGLVGLVPGLSPFIAVLLAVVSVQMMMARSAPALPGILARRRIATTQLARLMGALIPVLQRLECVVKPRWRTPFKATKRGVGVVSLLLSVTLLAPIPFSHIIPGLVIMLLAFAYVEEDGVLLCIALSAAVVSISITAVAIWGAIEGGRFLERSAG
jgi:hypothetical protein